MAVKISIRGTTQKVLVPYRFNFPSPRISVLTFTSTGMSDSNAHGTSSGPEGSLPKSKSGMRVALEFTGIPPSWLDKRPRLPSRNWLIFISVTSSIAGYYLYDRRQCNQIRQFYVDRVKHLADEPLHSLDVTRKVTVYGSKWPGDEDYERSMKYFRKYVKVCSALYYGYVVRN